MRYILLALVILILSFGAAVMPALSIPTPSPQPTRAITIELLTEPEPEDLFEVVDVFDSRHREGFLIWTKQEYFWQPGDYFNAGSLTVDITLDGMLTHPFVFWSSSASTSGYDEDQNVIGSYLSAAMEIGVDTAALPLGEHTMTIHLETPHHQVFMQSWDFVIRERETPRIPIPTDLAATAQYLWQSPEPTPIYMHSHRTAAAHLDLCQRGVEGICVTLDDSFLPDSYEITIDGQPDDMWVGTCNNDRICAETDDLAEGLHLAAVRMVVDGVTYSYTWAFQVQ